MKKIVFLVLGLALCQGSTTLAMEGKEIQKKAVRQFYPDRVKEELKKGENPEELLRLILTSIMPWAAREDSVLLVIAAGADPDRQILRKYLRTAIVDGEEFFLERL